MKQCNQAGLDLIKSFEGFRRQAYQDIAGIWTIGYGHTGNVHSGMAVTPEQAEQLLQADLSHAEHAINHLVVVDLTDNQFSALCSFAYNVGTGAFQHSTLLELLNNGDYGSVPSQLLRWNKAGGGIVEGLTRRRQAEADLWNAA